MSGPLRGFRILDLTSMVSGPLAAQILGDQGADVVKVENPRSGGDLTRSAPNSRGGFSALFLNNNRNKRSIALDLKHERGVEVLKRLASRADVFLQNHRPGVAERMGIGEAAIREASPAIVYVSISGFGNRGPLAKTPVYDPLVQALSGLATVQAGSDDARPRLVRTILPDKLTAVTAAQAITAALLERERSGRGQQVEVSMLDAVLAFLWASDMAGQTFVGEEVAQSEAASFIDLIYETADGFLSVAVQSDREWASLAQALGHPEWLADPRFSTPALRQRNLDARLSLVQEVLRGGRSSDWLERLRAADVPCAPVLTRTEVLRHPQVTENDSLIEFDHPRAGRLRQSRPAARFRETPSELRQGAPEFGEHTEDVLREAGYTPREIEALAASGVIVRARPVRE
jgi:crotonobetainyl-CoA:carnitine CoA-transferase CaiB-like acyl-CoA transferase